MENRQNILSRFETLYRSCVEKESKMRHDQPACIVPRDDSVGKKNYLSIWSPQKKLRMSDEGQRRYMCRQLECLRIEPCKFTRRLMHFWIRLSQWLVTAKKLSATTRRMLRYAWYLRFKREKIKMCKILVGKPEGKRQIGRQRSRWEDNIKNCVEGGGREVSSSGWGQGQFWAVVNSVMDRHTPYDNVSCWMSWENIRFSRRILLHGDG